MLCDLHFFYPSFIFLVKLYFLTRNNWTLWRVLRHSLTGHLHGWRIPKYLMIRQKITNFGTPGLGLNREKREVDCLNLMGHRLHNYNKCILKLNGHDSVGEKINSAIHGNKIILDKDKNFIDFYFLFQSTVSDETRKLLCFWNQTALDFETL